MKISFIIPCYNVEKYILRCVISIYAQRLDFDDFEVIVINDGSTDNTISIIDSLKYDNMRIINQNNLGLSCARNNGLSIAQGKYIWFIDSDDYILPNVVKPLLDRMENDRLDILFFGMCEIHNNEKKHIYHPEIPNNTVLLGEDAILLNYRPNSVCAGIYNTEFLNNYPSLKFYAKIYHQDVEFNYRATALAKRVMFIKEAPYIYEIHSNSISQSQDKQKVIKRLVDDSLIALSFREFSKTVSTQQVAQRIRRQATSILLSVLVSLVNLKYEYRKDIIKTMKENGTFPVKRDFNNFKQWVFVMYLNLKYYRY